MDGPVKPGHDSACFIRWVLLVKGQSASPGLTAYRQAQAQPPDLE